MSELHVKAIIKGRELNMSDLQTKILVLVKTWGESVEHLSQT
jgi:hypothetical protein